MLTRILSALALLLLAAPVAATQDGNVLHTIPFIEERLSEYPLEVVKLDPSRARLGDDDRTYRVLLEFDDGLPMNVKWKMPGVGAEGFNNEPRYELASYQLQKLFLDEGDYVVPPTVLRSLPIQRYREIDPAVTHPTFSSTSSVLVLLQYWLTSVTNRDVFDRDRFAADSVYARRLGELNILTYLINHLDSNPGNVLISTDSANPRLFAVDNDVAFRSARSDRGTDWSRLRVRRLPARSVERLRGITLAELEGALGVVAQFEIQGGHLLPVAPTQNLAHSRGVRRRDNVVQLGLTGPEIRDVHRRMQTLLRQVDSGRIETF